MVNDAGSMITDLLRNLGANDSGQQAANDAPIGPTRTRDGCLPLPVVNVKGHWASGTPAADPVVVRTNERSRSPFFRFGGAGNLTVVLFGSAVWIPQEACESLCLRPGWHLMVDASPVPTVFWRLISHHCLPGLLGVDGPGR